MGWRTLAITVLAAGTLSGCGGESSDTEVEDGPTADQSSSPSVGSEVEIPEEGALLVSGPNERAIAVTACVQRADLQTGEQAFELEGELDDTFDGAPIRSELSLYVYDGRGTMAIENEEYTLTATVEDLTLESDDRFVATGSFVNEDTFRVVGRCRTP